MRNLYFLLFGILFACSNNSFQQEQNDINHLISQYDSLLNSINNTDIQSSGSNLRKYNASLEYSKSKLSTKQIPSLETMKYLNDMKLLKRQFKNAPGTKDKLIKEVVRNQEQLHNLLRDIDNNVFEADKLNSIIISEKQAIKSLKVESYNFSEGYKNSELRFDSLYKMTETFNYQ